MAILPKVLLISLVCLACAPTSYSIKIFKSRRSVLEAVSSGTEEKQQFFTSCEMNNNKEACILAYDNDTSVEWSQCATTEPENDNMTRAFWRGYLETPAYVTSVYIQNADWKNNGQSDALMDFTISGNGETCYSHLGDQPFDGKSFPCDILADEIEIRSNQVNGSILAICEVVVYGAQLTFPTEMGEPSPIGFTDCDMSSIERHCYLAFDQKIDWVEKYDNATCAQTQAQSGLDQWWKATLEIPVLVQSVAIHNRKDSDAAKKEMNNFEVTIGKRRCGRLNNMEGFDFKTFHCNVFGSNIEIRTLNKGRAITLCEVIVHGHVIHLRDEQKRRLMGCFADKPDDPDMGPMPKSVSYMSHAKCDRVCRRHKKKFMGLQAGMECWCSDTHGKHGGENSTAMCQVTCEGARRELCGALDKNLVYELL